jgi:hypothetical protein
MTLVAYRLRPLLKNVGACRCLLPRLNKQAADCTHGENHNGHHERRSHRVRVGLVKHGFEQRLEAMRYGWCFGFVNPLAMLGHRLFYLAFKSRDPEAGSKAARKLPLLV